MSFVLLREDPRTLNGCPRKMPIQNCTWRLALLCEYVNAQYDTLTRPQYLKIFDVTVERQVMDTQSEACSRRVKCCLFLWWEINLKSAGAAGGLPTEHLHKHGTPAGW